MVYIKILEGLYRPNQEQEHGSRTRIMFVFLLYDEINRERKQLGTNRLGNDQMQEILFPVFCSTGAFRTCPLTFSFIYSN